MIFTKLYSWEHGFGIRYGKSRLNAEKTKCMQEVVYGCSGRTLKENSRPVQGNGDRNQECFAIDGSSVVQVACPEENEGDSRANVHKTQRVPS